jgi:hypothetical protein
MEYVIVIGLAIVIAVIAVASERRARAKGKRVSGALTGAFGSLDEVFRPATHSANMVQEAETRMPAPAPLAGDPGPTPNPSVTDTPGTATRAGVSLTDG